ncbi:MAG TPA: hypothetical protein P5186_27775 [Candidatus Paceibacterota bacterium]|nr:hypothetical protein [Verrucomicrobiota bacterium]HRY51851.1 hypothetical protein [Candidatus Paceibacterota bacterium]
MKSLISCLMLIAASTMAWAEVRAVTIAIGRGSDAPTGLDASYTVPAGKVLILESVQFTTLTANIREGEDVNIQITEVASNHNTVLSTFVYAGPYGRYKRHTFDPPIRILGGGRLSSNATYGWYLFKGLLVDNSDLYADLDVELENPRVQDGALLAQARVSSPRPHSLRVESSTDLKTFSLDPSAATTRSGNPAVDTVSVATGDTGKKFVRVEARTRSGR